MPVTTEKKIVGRSKPVRRRIAIIGPYPPAYGGISVHIQRVLQHLEAEEIEVDFYCETEVSTVKCGHRVYDFAGARKVGGLWRLLRGGYDLIHQHSPSPRLRVVLGILAMLGARVYLHVHGASLKDTTRGSSLIGWLTRKALRHCHVLADNAEIALLAAELGARSVQEVDAFLPPAFDPNVLSEFQVEFGEQFDAGRFTICMVGWFEEYKEADLYGFDTALEALRQLRDDNNGDVEVKLVASVNGVKSKEIEGWIGQYIEKHGLAEQVTFIRGSLAEIWPLYVMSDLFIRPSRSDGSALSLLEADWFETPVLASDCVPRPNQVTTFKTGDAAALCEAIRQLMSGARRRVAEKVSRIEKKRFRYKLFTDIYGIGTNE